MTEAHPRLPGLYDVVALETTDSSRAHAERLARRGAREGTLVWTKSQQEGIDVTTPSGRTSISLVDFFQSEFVGQSLK